jgi:hypothetical protein
MPIEIRCAGCGSAWTVADASAGQPAVCPGCGADLAAPPLANTAPVSPCLNAATPAIPSNTCLHLKLVGIFNVVSGFLNLLQGFFQISGIVFVLSGMYDKFLRQFQDQFPFPFMSKTTMIVVYVVLFLLSFFAGILCLAAGVWILQRRTGAWILGIIAGFVSTISLWQGCMFWPLFLASGIFTLIIMFRGGTKQALEGPPEA